MVTFQLQNAHAAQWVTHPSCDLDTSLSILLFAASSSSAWRLDCVRLNPFPFLFLISLQQALHKTLFFLSVPFFGWPSTSLFILEASLFWNVLNPPMSQPSICLSTASIVRCIALNRLQTTIALIPAAVEALFTSCLIVIQWNSGRRYVPEPIEWHDVNPVLYSDATYSSLPKVGCISSSASANSSPASSTTPNAISTLTLRWTLPWVSPLTMTGVTPLNWFYRRLLVPPTVFLLFLPLHVRGLGFVSQGRIAPQIHWQSRHFASPDLDPCHRRKQRIGLVHRSGTKCVRFKPN